MRWARPVNQLNAMRQTLLISCVALAGCVGGHQTDQSEVRSAETSFTPASDLAWEPEQGTHILGSFPDQLMVGGNHIRVSTQPAFPPNFRLSVTSAVDGANLVADSTDSTDSTAQHEGADPWFIGMILAAPDGGQLRITGATLPAATSVPPDEVITKASSTLYSLEYRPLAPDGTYGAPVDYCGGTGGAIALHGGYDKPRTHHSVGAISFACPDGIAYKCNFWGYVAGNVGPGTRGWSHHQACTGMGNANYCGTGQSFTREKTPIQIRDDVPEYGSDGLVDLGHPTVMPGDPDMHYIEAGWDEHGSPICLSKSRWAGLPPNPCPGVLLDPRFSNNQEARFCDDFTMAELFAEKGAILVNGSKTMDAPLHRWSIPGGDVVSTIRGYFIDRDGDGNPDPDSTLPFPGYTDYLGTEGMLLRNLPGTLSPDQMKPLYMQNLAGGDRYLSDTGTGKSDPSFEGYSFLEQDTRTNLDRPVPGLLPFSECAWNPLDHDTRLTETSGASGCTTVKSLSFALPAP